MARSLAGFLLLLFVALASSSVTASIFRPISDSHRSVALELFAPINGAFPSLEETYEALRTFEVLGIDKKAEISSTTCKSVVETFGSSSSTPKNLFHALKVNGILKCEINEEVLQGIVSKLQAAVSSASTLIDFYYSIGSLALIKDQIYKDVYLEDAEGIFRSIKALSQSDGRWRYSSSKPESSTFAAGLALEALAGVVSLSSSEIDQTLISTTKNDILKLLDSIEKYDDGSLYFDEKLVDAQEHHGSLSTTSSVVRGLAAFASVASGSLNLQSNKIVGLAKFFLSIDIPGDAKDLFNQVDSLAFLESNRVSIPLILSPTSTVLSLTQNAVIKRFFSGSNRLMSNPLQAKYIKVKVNTVLGTKGPPLTVNLAQVLSSGAKGASVIENQELKYDPKDDDYFLDTFPEDVDVGSYIFVYEVVFHDPEHKKVYATEKQTRVPMFLTGDIKIDNAEVEVLDSDLGTVEVKKKLDLSGENPVSLSANHLQKLRLSFKLTTPLGSSFKPHQAILTLRHESKVEHVFLVGNSGEKFEIILDFLGLVEKFFYLSGTYDIELTVGDACMENSFWKAIGNVELDLPERPEKAPRPPAQAVEASSRYGPKAEINHIFRLPEKLPPQELSFAFLGLTLLPLLGFLIGLLRLGVNLKNLPSSAVPLTFAVLFHVGIAAVLLLYVLFWVKLDLFTTLKGVGFLGVFLMFVGHRILSHLASTSSKLKSA